MTTSPSLTKPVLKEIGMSNDQYILDMRFIPLVNVVDLTVKQISTGTNTKSNDSRIKLKSPRNARNFEEGRSIHAGAP
jgi:hypothetical protein